MIPIRLIIPAALLVAACAEAPAPAETPAEATSVRTPWVKARSPAGIALLQAPARVLPGPAGEAALSPPFPARIARVLVQPGDRVEAGAPLVEVVMPEVVAAAGRLAAAGERIAAQEKRREALLSLGAHGMALRSDLAEVEAALGEARAERLASRAILASAGLGDREAAALLRGTGTVPLRAPIAGVVTELDAPVGAVREGSAIARIAGSSPGRIEARLPIAPPEGARFTFTPAGGAAHAVSLIASSPVVDRSDGSRTLFLHGDESIPAGTSGTLRLELPEGDAVAVPARSVRLQGGGDVIFVRRGDRPEAAPVQVLASSGAEALVRGGSLREGDEVAADAVLLTAVQPRAEEAP